MLHSMSFDRARRPMAIPEPIIPMPLNLFNV